MRVAATLPAPSVFGNGGLVNKIAYETRREKWRVYRLRQEHVFRGPSLAVSGEAHSSALGPKSGPWLDLSRFRFDSQNFSRWRSHHDSNKIHNTAASSRNAYTQTQIGCCSRHIRRTWNSSPARAQAAATKNAMV